MSGNRNHNSFGWGHHHNPPPPPTPNTHQFTAFKGSDLITGGRNYLSIGYSFVMPAVATTCLTVTDDDNKLSGDQKKNERGDDKSYQTADIEHDGVQVQDDVKIYSEQYYLLRGSDGNIYKLLEIEIKGISQYGNDKVDYYSFIGNVPPAGVSLKVIGVKEVGSSGIKYSDLGAGPKDTDPTFGAGITDGDATEITDGAVGENATTHTASGAIAFTDNVGDSHTVDVVPDSVSYVGTMTASITDLATPDGVGEVTWNFSVDDQDLDGLGEGETVEQTYDIVLEDNGGGTDVKTVKITLTGANDVPVFGEVVEFAQGFETDADGILDGTNGWFGAVTVVPSGTNGVASPDGSSHAILTQSDDTGPFTRFDGYRADFTGDWVAEVKVFLDTGWALGEGFDYSVASSGSDGGHQRDFIFHVTKDTSTGELLVAGSNNTNFDPREDLDTLPNHYVVPSSGWFTLQHVFHDNGGVLSVDLNLVDENGVIVFTETRSDPSDTIGAGGAVGGNRYGWFANIDVAGGIAVDSYSLSVPDYQAPQMLETAGTPGPADELTTSGDIQFEDVDLIDTHAASATFASASLSNGDAVSAPLLAELASAMSALVSDDSTGDTAGTVSWAFTLDAESAEFLAAGQVLTAVYDVSVTDDPSTSDTVQVTVTIVGSNDAPIIVAGTTGSVKEPGDIAGIDEAGLGGGLEPTIALNSTITDALDSLPGNPGDVATVLSTIAGELGGNAAQAIAVVWDYLDDTYVSAGPLQPNINEAFARLGVAYVEYLQDGGSPLVDVVAKFIPDGVDADTLPERNQSLHDNLLGNLSSVALGDRFSGSLLTDLTNLVSGVDPDLLTRIYYDGQDNHPTEEAAARQFDLDNGFVPTAEGTLVASDVDAGSSVSFVPGTTAGAYGTFVVDASGGWTYTLDSEAAQSLAEGEEVVEQFNVVAMDEHGATGNALVSVTVQGTNDENTLVAAVNATLDASSAPGGEMYFGSGNFPTNYNVETIADHDIELGLKIHYRQGDDIPAIGADVDGDAQIYVVPDGPQVVDPAHSVPVANAARAAWSFDYSINTSLNGSADTLDDFNFQLLIDLDPTSGVDYLALTLDTGGVGSSNHHWEDSLDNTIIPDDEGTTQITQNSQNLAFYAAGIDTDPDTGGIQPYTFGAGEFDIELRAFSGATLIGSVHDTILVV